MVQRLLYVFLITTLLIAYGECLKCFECAGDNCYDHELANNVTCVPDAYNCYTGIGTLNGGTAYTRGCGTTKVCEPAGIPWLEEVGGILSDCYLCEEDLCNIDSKPMKCYACFGSSADQCDDANLLTVNCPEGTCATFEVTLNEAPMIYKDCARYIENFCELESQGLEEMGVTVTNCTLCNTEFCNRNESVVPEPLNCYSCRGFEKTCNITNMNTKICKENEMFCVSGIGLIEEVNGDPYFLRDCATGPEVCPGILSFIENMGGTIMNCTVCESTNCNDASATPEEFSCFACSGSDDVCHDSNKMKKRMCIDDESSCYAGETKLANGTTIYMRDCAQNASSCTDTIEAAGGEIINCITCNSHLCNGAVKTSTLECYECSGKKEDCKDIATMPRKQCGPNDYVCVKAEGLIEENGYPVVARGCSPDEPYCSEATSILGSMGVKEFNCTYCLYDLCNGAKCEDGLCNSHPSHLSVLALILSFSLYLSISTYL